MSVRKARVLPATRMAYVVQGQYGPRYGNRWEDLDRKDSLDEAAELVKKLRAEDHPAWFTFKYRVDAREVENVA